MLACSCRSVWELAASGYAAERVSLVTEPEIKTEDIQNGIREFENEDLRDSWSTACRGNSAAA